MSCTPSDPFVVLKFGGSSVASPECWRHIAELINDHIASHRHPVLVCSAVRGVTDDLTDLVDRLERGLSTADVIERIRLRHLDLAQALGLAAPAVIDEGLTHLEDLVTTSPSPLPPARRAAIISMGEVMSTRLGAAWLESCALDVGWTDATTLLSARSGRGRQSRAAGYLSASCAYDPSPLIQDRLRRRAPATITQGFIAANRAGETVLLGRGGSDTSAAYLAAILQAEALEIWTDVPGVFTVDPRRVDEAWLVPRLSYTEAAVLGALGAKILHPRCLQPAEDAGIPLAIRWSARPEVSGTRIGRGPEYETPGIKAVATRSELQLVRMRRGRSWQPVGFMAEVAGCFQRAGLSMDLVSSSASEIRATIDLAASPSASQRLEDLLGALSELCEPTTKGRLACVSLAGNQVSADVSRLASALRSLEDASALHLVSHAADDTHVSYVLDGHLAQQAVESVHDAVFDGESRPPPGPSWRQLQSQPTPAANDPVTPVRGNQHARQGVTRA